MSGIVNSTGAKSGVIGTTVGTPTGGKVLGFHSSVASENQTISTTSFVAVDIVYVTLPVTESGSKMLMTFNSMMVVPASTPWNVISFGKSSSSGGTYTELTGESWGIGFWYHGSGGVSNNMIATWSFVHTHGESVDTDIYYKLMGRQDGVNFDIGQPDADTTMTLMELSTA